MAVFTPLVLRLQHQNNQLVAVRLEGSSHCQRKIHDFIGARLVESAQVVDRRQVVNQSPDGVLNLTRRVQAALVHARVGQEVLVEDPVHQVQVLRELH